APGGMRLDSSCDRQAKCAMPDAGLVKGLAHCSYFACGQQSTDSAQVGLEDIIRIAHQALPIRVQPPESFASGDQNVHFPGKPRRGFEVVSREWLLQPVHPGFLERLRRGQSGRVVPDLSRYVRGTVDHDFETRSAGGEYPGAGLDV